MKQLGFYLKNIFYKKAFAKTDIKCLEAISLDDFEFKKSSDKGVSELFLRACEGEKLTKKIDKGKILTKEYFSSKSLQDIEKKIHNLRSYYIKKAVK